MKQIVFGAVLALLAAGLGPGDEIICPTFTYIASAASICHAGATPVVPSVLASIDAKVLVVAN